MKASDRLLRALQDARAEGHGVVLTSAEREELARLVAHVARGVEPAPRTEGERVRLLGRMAARGTP